ncbi:unnamed protein product [Fraxinus pennsylvanica]|uniref:DUF4283 domain-containing protein n=1 Tax=Fraxinus pennsylvanica TaxID=56036 RepID=A0AAD1YV05_9LAMI|nr:unnamed protein product [Fraxinus pennsylvanica]
MARDLSSLFTRLRLTEKEAQVLEVVEAVDGLLVEKRAKCLAFRVLAEPEVNKGALKTTMLQIWQLEGKAVIKEIGRNTFLLELIRVSDKKRILSGRPWSFDKILLCLHDCERVNTIKEIGFTEEVFWVQYHDLPFAGMTQNTGQAIGERLGKVLVVDTDSTGFYFGAFLRVKVLIDILKPLLRGCLINIGRTQYWVPFKYERLPNFCYHCGLVFHPSGRCSQKENGSAIGDGLEQQYGPWLRASRKKFAGLSSSEGADQTQLHFPSSSCRKPSKHLTAWRRVWCIIRSLIISRRISVAIRGSWWWRLSGMISVQKFRNWIIVGQIAHVGMFYWTWAMVQIGKKRARSSPILARPQLMEVDGFEPIALSTTGQEDVDAEGSSPKRVRRVLGEKDDFGLAVAGGQPCEPV